MNIVDIKVKDFSKSMKEQINQFIEQVSRNEEKLKEIEELVDENKDTAQYQGICESILTILRS